MFFFLHLDVDECANAALFSCPFGSECLNIEGSYACPCAIGYNVTMDGKCEGI